MLILSLRPSPWLAPTLGLLHLLAALAPWTSQLLSHAPWLAALVSLLVFAHGLRCWRPYQSSPASRTRLLRIGSSDCELQAGESVFRTALPRPLYRGPLLSVLRLDGPEGSAPHTLLLWPDSLDAEDWRRLRCWLRGQARGAGVQA